MRTLYYIFLYQIYLFCVPKILRRAFYDEFQSDIPIKYEVIVKRVALFEEDGTPRTEAVTKDDREHSQWYDRNILWLHRETRDKINSQL